MRTLRVDRDEHGERWSSWRSASSFVVTDEFSEFPVERPRTVQWEVQSFAREGHDPVTWLEKTLATKRFSETDRSVYELWVIAEVLRLAGCYDQLSLAGLACMEALVRRRQSIWEAHNRDHQVACYGASDRLQNHRSSHHLSRTCLGSARCAIHARGCRHREAEK